LEKACNYIFSLNWHFLQIRCNQNDAWTGGRGAQDLRDVALPQGTAVPPPAPEPSREEMLLGTLSPYQLVSVPIAWLETSECCGILSNAQPALQALFSKQRLVHITHYILYILYYKL